MAAEVLQATLDYLGDDCRFCPSVQVKQLEEWLIAFIGKLMAQLQLLGGIVSSLLVATW